MRDLWRGNANAWECDEMGHLNVRAYAEKALEALASLAAELGLPTGETPIDTSVLRATELHVRWIAEARAGAPLEACGGVVALGADSLEAAVVMSHVGDGRPAAGFLLRVEHVSPSTGRAFPWARRMAEAARCAMIAPPDEATPRSLKRAPSAQDASLDRAEALDLLEIGRGVFRVNDADATGHVRVSAYIGRASDGAARLFMDAIGDSAATGIGVALVEARLIFLRAPRPGDRFVIRSGFRACDAKMARAVHWFLDPASGKAWATMEGAALFFDLAARRSRPLEPARLKPLKARVRSELRP